MTPKYEPGELVESPIGDATISRVADAPAYDEPVYSVLVFDKHSGRLKHHFFEESLLKGTLKPIIGRIVR